MIEEKIFIILEICLPVFIILGLGYVLFRKNILQENHLGLLNFIVYYFSLPAIVFLGVSGQEISLLLDKGVIISTIVPTFVTLFIFLALAYMLSLPRETKSGFIYSVFWCNMAYVGFPIINNAFGSEGLTFAAVVNAFGMSTQVALGFLLLALFSKEEGGKFKRLRSAVLNPVVLASLLGILFAYLRSVFLDESLLAMEETVLRDTSYAYWIMLKAASIGEGVLIMLSSMGLPLALICVGANMDFKSLRSKPLPLFLILCAKLILLPLLTYFVCGYFMSPDSIVFKTTVLLMAMPGSVAGYVASKKYEMDSELTSNHLVLSTCLSVISLPIWLYVLL